MSHLSSGFREAIRQELAAVIGESMAQANSQATVTQKAWADRLKISQAEVSMLNRGLGDSFKIDRLLDVFERLGANPSIEFVVRNALSDALRRQIQNLQDVG